MNNYYCYRQDRTPSVAGAVKRTVKQITPLAALVGFKTGVKRELGSKENNSTDDVLDINPQDELLLDKKAATRDQQGKSVLDRKTMNGTHDQRGELFLNKNTMNDTRDEQGELQLDTKAMKNTRDEQDELLLDRKAMLATRDQMRLERESMRDDVSSLDGSQSSRDTVKKVFFNDLVKQHRVDDDEEINNDDNAGNRRSNSDNMNESSDTMKATTNNDVNKDVHGASSGDNDYNDRRDDDNRNNNSDKFNDFGNKDNDRFNDNFDKDDYKEKLEDDKLLKDYVPADGNGSGSGSISSEDADKRSAVTEEESKTEAAVPRDGGGGQEISGNSPIEDSVLHGPEAGISRVFIEPMIVKKKKRSKIMLPEIISSSNRRKPKNRLELTVINDKASNTIKRNRLRLFQRAVFSGEP